MPSIALPSLQRARRGKIENNLVNINFGLFGCDGYSVVGI